MRHGIWTARFSSGITLSGALAIMAASASASTLSLGAAQSYNAFVFGNFTEYSTDSAGAIAAGGNFAPANNGSFTVASGHAADGAGVWDLVVAGSFTDQYASLGGGSAFVGGNMTWSDPTLPHNAYVNGNFSNPAWGGSAGGTIFHYGSFSSNTALNNQSSGLMVDPIDFISAQTNLKSVSATLAAQQANGTVSSAYNTYTLTGSSSAINIFSLTDTSYNGSTINITAPAGSTVVINVAGSSDSFSGGSINLNGVSANDVIWNFSTAATVSIGSIAFNGTLLAPTADFTGTWGQLNGQLIANSAAGTTELHDVLFSGTLTGGAPPSYTSQTVTPEPATWIMLISGAGLIALGRRRSQKR